MVGKTGAGEGIRTLDPNLGKIRLVPFPVLTGAFEFFLSL
ncbi:protein of unassigned function [Methylobacterium oryzae CBMB20]|uniref:Protein of unassigned function n=1 Tax=Methylobacterium oryzae CBMB20 TaxID=693986 RepID=A0A089NZA6_9HYPH|nr:protein of unassigned function [Methylobacterium oryzae CBMB20]